MSARIAQAMTTNPTPIGLGAAAYELAEELFPICRSITGDGVRETLSIIQRTHPSLVVHEVPTGTQCFDWEVPEEWNIRDAYIEDSSGKRIVDFRDSNLHVVGYSEPVDTHLSLEELQKNLYSLPDNPDVIPYITSYFERRWGFCLTDAVRNSLPEDEYHVVIDSTLEPGSLTYGELVFKGQSTEEIFFSTYVCHPSMANNELSGPVVMWALAQLIAGMKDRKFTYRIVFIPETIGSITYLSRNLQHLRSHVVGGFNLSCVGDDRCYSYLPSPRGTALSDRVAQHVLDFQVGDYKKYSFLDRGSDERQYCSPLADLPICSILRSKFATYPEYHTSSDDLSVISPAGLQGSIDCYFRAIQCLEQNHFYRATVVGEPQMGKRGLYPTLARNERSASLSDMMNILAYSDGKRDLLEIAETIQRPMWEILEAVDTLLNAELLEPCN